MHETPKNIVIAGAGFAGITVALKLEKELRHTQAWRIILADQNAYHLYTPPLYEIASVPKESADAIHLKSAITIPLEHIVSGTHITFLQGEMMGIDRTRRIIRIDEQEYAYEFLVIALGSVTNYSNIPGLREYAIPLKHIHDAVIIRNKIETALMHNTDLDIVVGGAGPSGVELIAEFSNFICRLREKILKNTACKNRLILVESADEILPGFQPSLIGRTRKRLQALGIDIRTHARIVSVTAEEIILENQSRIPYHIFIWTGGVLGNPFYKNAGLPLTQKQNCVVNEFLEVEKYIYAIGDAAGFIDQRTKKSLVWNIPVAESQARLVAKNIIRRMQEKAQIPFRPARRYPYILALGRKYAIADLLIVRFWGVCGWIAKLLVEFRYLLFILPPRKALSLWLRSIKMYASND